MIKGFNLLDFMIALFRRHNCMNFTIFKIDNIEEKPQVS